MQSKRWGWFKVASLGLSAFLWLAGSLVLAQGQAPPQLFITGSNVSSLPSVELHIYGIDSQGDALNPSPDSLAIEHNGVSADSIESVGQYEAGTFTVFLIDIPTGVTAQLPAIQDAIGQYAGAPTMMEQVDAIAIYQAGETEARELLAPTGFHNSVRNLFATPLQPETEVTALVDSIMSVLAQTAELKPEPDMAASLVVISDGTDVVSTQFQPEDIPARAVSLGIPVHTIWLENEDLSSLGQEGGRNYLAQLASSTYGRTENLSNTAELSAIWEQIATFRNQSQIRYTVAELSGGTFPVEISLAEQPEVRAETTVTIPANSPSITINVPPESRTLTLPDLEDPVTLRFETTVGWLDDTERELVAAQLTVNGTVVQDIPVDDIEQFTAEIETFVFGTNTVRIAILDEQGRRATSPSLALTIFQGPREIPSELQAGGGFVQTVLRLLLTLVVLAVLATLAFLAWRRGWLSRLPELVPRGPSGRRGRRRVAPAGPRRSQVAGQRPQTSQAAGQAIARLQVLEAISRMPAEIPLNAAVIRIGRSPTQADVVFQNDITVSRLHASLMLEGNHYRIFDERSTSGTWVNEKQVPEYGTQLIDGDEVHLGAVHLRFRQP
jgi:hypothetical protein